MPRVSALADDLPSHIGRNQVRDYSVLAQLPLLENFANLYGGMDDAALQRAGMAAATIESHIPFLGSLLKTEQDSEALKRYSKQGGSFPSSWSDLGPRYNQ